MTEPRLECPDFGGGARQTTDHEASRHWAVAASALRQLYGRRPGYDAWLRELQTGVQHWRARRRPALRDIDQARGGSRAWIQGPEQVGYSFYVDRFAGDLTGVIDRVPYLRELGVTYVHPLPLLRARQGDSDGGFAVADFRQVEPRLGAVEDLERLARSLHEQGMALVLDVVCNHTAAEHPWAQSARAGDVEHQAYYHVIKTKDEVDALEAHLPEVFPNTCPGNFTWSPEIGGWVWTSFHNYQWDLNYSNPKVFEEMLDNLLFLTDLGVDGFRLDSTAFLWKRAGTACRNQPECHLILQAWRALVSMVAPSVVFTAEAIEQMETVLPFFGSAQAPECDLAYSNGVMAALWASLALEDATPVRDLIAAAAAKPANGVWLNYVRCHDDLIWSALTPEVPTVVQRAVSAFFCGEAPDSYASGEPFQTLGAGVASTNGMAADLCGVNTGGAGLDRLMLLYSVCYALDGVPTIYMGDEIALGNNAAYRADPAQASDGRWLHRPRMDWPRAEERHRPQRTAGAMFQRLQLLAKLRKGAPGFAAGHPALPMGRSDSGAVLAFARGGRDGVVCVANFSAETLRLATTTLGAPENWNDLIASETGAASISLLPYQVRWLVEAR